jgi:hypothetical protein
MAGDVRVVSQRGKQGSMPKWDARIFVSHPRKIKQDDVPSRVAQSIV